MSEVVPCLTEALENNYSFRIKIQNIPACLMIKYNEILVKAEDKKNSYMDSETRKEVSLTKEIKSLKIKPKICSQCVLNRECDGIWKGYHDIYGHKELTAINYYGKSRYKIGFSCNNRCLFCVQGDKRDFYGFKPKKEVVTFLKYAFKKGKKKLFLLVGNHVCIQIF